LRRQLDRELLSTGTSRFKSRAALKSIIPNADREHGILLRTSVRVPLFGISGGTRIRARPKIIGKPLTWIDDQPDTTETARAMLPDQYGIQTKADTSTQDLERDLATPPRESHSSDR
jgi:hypothetical protein